MDNNKKKITSEEIFAGGGEMGELIRSHDWSKTSLGSPDKWPQSLRTIVRIMLTSQQPIWIGWGKELIKLYNDPYKAIVGGKHPWALGQPASIVWRDIWDAVGPRLEKVMQQNEGTYDESLLLMMERYGYPEETYYTFSYSPVPDDHGDIGGIFCANTDDTQRIIGERQLALLRDLASNTVNAKILDELYKQSAESLETNPKDLPFAMIYMIEEDEQSLKLVGASGITSEHKAAGRHSAGRHPDRRLHASHARPGRHFAPEKVDLAHKSCWPFQEVINTGRSVIVNDLKKTFDHPGGIPLPTGAWNRPPHQAVVVPVSQSGHAGKTGVLVVGLNPFRLFDEGYQGFINLIAGQIAANAANIQAYEEERKRAEALAEIDKAKTIFFSNVSHEFRTPLTLMLGPIEDAVNDAVTTPANKERMEIAHRNSLRLLRLVNTLLDFSRIEAGRIDAVFKQTDICQYTTDLSSAFRSAMEKAGIKLNIHCGEIKDQVYVDHTMWERIVFNLLSNALKFTFKGEVSVLVRQAEKHLELIVKDTGTGIPKEELPKLFSRFHRIENARGRTHEGSGIGLAMVYELVKLHEGAIQVDSELGKGTTFTISIPTGKDHLPAAHLADGNVEKTVTLSALPDIEEELGIFNDAKLSDIPPLANTLPTGNSVKEKILLADDNADMREYLVRLLGNHYEIKAVADGNQALKAVKEDKPSLILSDIMMPNLDGMGLLKQLRSDEDTKTIPVIFISARAGEEAKIAGIEAGADDYLIKPFSAKELFARVQTYLAMSKLRKQAEEAVKTERQRFSELFKQAPAAIAVVEGPDQVYTLANPLYQKLFSRTEEQLLGKTIRQVFPEIEGQGIYELFDTVFQSGEAFVANEYTAVFDRTGKGVFEKGYFNFVAQPMRDNNGHVNAIMIHAFEVTEQVRAKQKVEESKEKYRNLFETMDQGFCIIEMIFDTDNKPLDYRFLEINPTFEQQTGLKGAAGKTARELVPNLEARWFEIYGSVALTGEPTRFIEGSDAMARWFEVYAFRLGGNESRKVALLFTDITERKQVEETLKRSNEWFQLVNQATQDAIWDWDLVTQQISWNEGVRTMFNYKPEEVGPDVTWWYEHVHPEDREMVVHNIHKAINSGEVHWSEEYRYLTGDGGFKIVYDRGFVIHDETGKPVRMIGSMQDITERKQAEQAVKESENYFRTFANNIQNLAWMAEPDGWIFWYNDLWYDYTGTTLEEMQGWGWEKVHPPDHTDRVVAFVKEAWGRGETWELTFPLRGADGQYRWFLTRAYPVKDAEGNVVRWIGTNTNIHDQKIAEQQHQVLTQELAASNEELAAANEEIQASLEELSGKNQALSAINADMDNFIYTASHDLKAPIANIEGLMRTLEQRLSPDDMQQAIIQKLVAMIYKSIDRFKHTIIDLTEITKLQKESQEAPTQVNLTEVMEEICLDLETAIQDSGARFDIDFTQCSSIQFSKKNMRSVMYNLVSNAIKYHDPDREPFVRVSSKAEQHFCVLIVEDNGLGIDLSQESKIFSMFKRLHNHVEGTGLGLYIIKKIVENSGGKIKVQSEVGKGSTFEVYFKN